MNDLFEGFEGVKPVEAASDPFAGFEGVTPVDQAAPAAGDPLSVFRAKLADPKEYERIKRFAGYLGTTPEDPTVAQRLTNPLNFSSYSTLNQLKTTGNVDEVNDLTPEGNVAGLGLKAALTQFGHAGGVLRRRNDALVGRIAAGQELEVGDTRDIGAQIATGMAGAPRPNLRTFKKIEDMTRAEQDATVPKEIVDLVNQYDTPEAPLDARTRAKAIYEAAKSSATAREQTMEMAAEELALREELTGKSDGFMNSLGVLAAKGMPTVGYGQTFLVGGALGGPAGAFAAATAVSGADKTSELLTADINPDTGEVEKQGTDYDDARTRGYAYGAFEAASEQFTGKVLGGIFRGADKITGGYVGKALSKGLDAGARQMAKTSIGRGVAGLAKGIQRIAGLQALENPATEGLEEGIQQWGDAVFAQRPSDTETPVYVKNVLNEATGEMEQMQVEPGSDEERTAKRMLTRYGEKSGYAEAGTRQMTVGEKTKEFAWGDGVNKGFVSWENLTALAEGFALQYALTLGTGAMHAVKSKESRGIVDKSLLAAGFTNADLIRMSDEKKAEAFDGFYGNEANREEFAGVFKDAGEMLSQSAQRAVDSDRWMRTGEGVKPNFSVDVAKETENGAATVDDEQSGLSVDYTSTLEGTAFTVRDRDGVLSPMTFNTAEEAQKGAEKMSQMKQGRQMDMEKRAEVATRVAQVFAPGRNVVLVQSDKDMKAAAAAEGADAAQHKSGALGVTTPNGTIIVNVAATASFDELVQTVKHETGHSVADEAGLTKLMAGKTVDGIAAEFQKAGIIPPGADGLEKFVKAVESVKAQRAALGVKQADADAVGEVLSLQQEGMTPLFRKKFGDGLVTLLRGKDKSAENMGDVRRAVALIMYGGREAKVDLFGGTDAWKAPVPAFTGDPIAAAGTETGEKEAVESAEEAAPEAMPARGEKAPGAEAVPPVAAPEAKTPAAPSPEAEAAAKDIKAAFEEKQKATAPVEEAAPVETPPEAPKAETPKSEPPAPATPVAKMTFPSEEAMLEYVAAHQEETENWTEESFEIVPAPAPAKSDGAPIAPTSDAGQGEAVPPKAEEKRPDAAPFEVEGLKFNGVQRIEGMEDQQVWTDVATGGTFFMPGDADKAAVEAYRDGSRKKFEDAKKPAPAKPEAPRNDGSLFPEKDIPFNLEGAEQEDAARVAAEKKAEEDRLAEAKRKKDAEPILPGIDEAAPKSSSNPPLSDSRNADLPQVEVESAPQVAKMSAEVEFESVPKKGQYAEIPGVSTAQGKRMYLIQGKWGDGSTFHVSPTHHGIVLTGMGVLLRTKGQPSAHSGVRIVGGGKAPEGSEKWGVAEWATHNQKLSNRHKEGAKASAPAPAAKKTSLAKENGAVIENEGGYIDVQFAKTDFSPRPQSIIDFVVDEKKRGKGYGKKLLTEALRRYDNLGGQASSRASVKVMWSAGMRNPAKPNASLEDLFAILDVDSSVYMAAKNEKGELYSAIPAAPAPKMKFASEEEMMRYVSAHPELNWTGDEFEIVPDEKGEAAPAAPQTEQEAAPAVAQFEPPKIKYGENTAAHRRRVAAAKAEWDKEQAAKVDAAPIDVRTPHQLEQDAALIGKRVRVRNNNSQGRFEGTVISIDAPEEKMKYAQRVVVRTDDGQDTVQLKSGIELIADAKDTEEIAELQANAETSARVDAIPDEVYVENPALAVMDVELPFYEARKASSARTADSKERQAYSTPPPLAAIGAAALAGAGGGNADAVTVIEPTAGNGGLIAVLGLSEGDKILANELDAGRAARLSELFPDVTVTQGDYAAEAYQQSVRDAAKDGPRAFLMNPPFGPTDESGYKLEHKIALKTIESAVPGDTLFFIGAAPGRDAMKMTTGMLAGVYTAGAFAKFHQELNRRGWKATLHFIADGALYRKMGASFPVEVLLMEKTDGSEMNPHMPMRDLPARYSTWEQIRAAVAEMYDPGAETLGERVANDLNLSGKAEQARAEAQGNAEASSAEVNAARVKEGAAGTLRYRLSQDIELGLVTPETGLTLNPFMMKINGKVWDKEFAGKVRNPDQLARHIVSLPEEIAEARIKVADAIVKHLSANPANGFVTGTGFNSMGPALREAFEARWNAARTTDMDAEEDKAQIEYAPLSAVKVASPMKMPRELAGGMATALISFDERHPEGIDTFVAEKMRRPMTEKELDGSQIDTLGLALEKIDEGTGFIVGSMTGSGKGRVMGSVMDYHILNGRVPIFLTAQAKLFTDIWRDITAIGAQDRFKPLVMNDYKTPKNEDPDSEDVDAFSMPVFFTPVQRNSALSEGNLPQGANAIFLTYSQVQNPTANTRLKIDLIKKLLASGKGALVMDEAHLAAGADSNRGAVLREFADLAKPGVVFSSATFAKRGENMTLYKRAGYSQFFKNDEDMEKALMVGGVPFQQYLAARLTERGFYVRHELDYEGVVFSKLTTIDTLGTLEEGADMFSPESLALKAAQTALSDREEQIADVFNQVVRTVMRFGGLVRSVNSRLQKGAPGANMDGAAFMSSLHNTASFIYTALKAETVANAAVAELRAGRAPVVTLYNTNQALLTEIGLNQSANVGRYLTRISERAVSIQMPDGSSASILTPAGFGELVRLVKAQEATMLRDAADALVRQARSAADYLQEQNLPASPIDRVREIVQNAGYQFGEVTGRTIMVQNGVVVRRIKPNPDTVIRQFNQGAPDGSPNMVLLLNSSGSTGLSAHASSDFRNQARRVMFVLQPSWDINEMMQMFGRVNRKNQLSKPIYHLVFTSAAGEQRNAAILMSKLRSLAANTSGVSKAGYGEAVEDALDFMNAFGDKALAELAAERNPVVASINTLRASTSIRTATSVSQFLPVREQEQFIGQIQAKVAALQDNAREAGLHDLEAGDIGRVPLTVEQLLSNSAMRAYEVAVLGRSKILTASEAVAAAQAWQAKHPTMLDDAKAKIDKAIAGTSNPWLKRIYGDTAQVLEHALDSIGRVYYVRDDVGGGRRWFVPIEAHLPPSGTAQTASDWRVKVSFNTIRGVTTIPLSIFADKILSNAAKSSERNYNETLTRKEDRTIIAGDVAQALIGNIVATGASGASQIVRALPADGNFSSFVLMMPRGVTVANAKKIASSRLEKVTDVMDIRVGENGYLEIDAGRARVTPTYSSTTGDQIGAVFAFRIATPIKSKSKEITVAQIMRAAGAADRLRDTPDSRGYVTGPYLGVDEANTALKNLAALHPALQATQIVSDEAKVGGQDAVARNAPRFKLAGVKLEAPFPQRPASLKHGNDMNGPEEFMAEIKRFADEMKAWKQAVTVWAESAPRVLPFIHTWTEKDGDRLVGKGIVNVVHFNTRNTENPWRYSHFSHENGVVDTTPNGHSEFKTKGEAVIEASRTGNMRYAPELRFKLAGVKLDAAAEPVFFSQLRRTLEAKMPNRMTVMALRGMIDPAKGSGVKADEIEWTGLKDFLDGKNPGDYVTKAEVLEAVRDVQIEEVLKSEPFEGMDDTAENPTKFSQYQLAGGENYRELLLTLPSEQLPLTLTTEWRVVQRRGMWDHERRDSENGRWGEWRFVDTFADESIARMTLPKSATSKTTIDKTHFKSSHFSEPNILAHIRFNERQAANGDKTLFLEEVQSDWMQAGRDKGFIGDRKFTVERDGVKYWVKDSALSPETWAKARRFNTEDSARMSIANNESEWRRNDAGKVPDAPFKDTSKGWARLAFKRMLRWGAENGFDRIAWTTGEQQAERYDLSKKIERVSYNDLTGQLMAWEVGAYGDPGRLPVLRETVPIEKSADYVGKEAAQKLIAAAPVNDVRSISGDDLRVGGEGMRTFYDQILPSIANDLGKKFGARVEDTQIANAEVPFKLNPDGSQQTFAPASILTVHSLPVTPAMRDSVMQGQPRFKLPGVKLDAEYADAVAKGDMETAQRMVDEAAKRAGYNFGPVWHSSSEVFNVFRKRYERDGVLSAQEASLIGRFGKGIFFSSDPVVSEKFGRVKRKFYLKIDELTEYDLGGASYYDGTLHDQETGEVLLDDDGKPMKVDQDMLPDEMSEIQLDDSGTRNTGVIVRGVYESIPSKGKPKPMADTYVVGNPSQIKSADAATYDDNGDLIPLSRRFDDARADIRFKLPGVTLDGGISAPVRVGELRTQTQLEKDDPVGFPILDHIRGGSRIIIPRGAIGRKGEYNWFTEAGGLKAFNLAEQRAFFRHPKAALGEKKSYGNIDRLAKELEPQLGTDDVETFANAFMAEVDRSRALYRVQKERQARRRDALAAVSGHDMFKGKANIGETMGLAMGSVYAGLTGEAKTTMDMILTHEGDEAGRDYMLTHHFERIIMDMAERYAFLEGRYEPPREIEDQSLSVDVQINENGDTQSAYAQTKETLRLLAARFYAPDPAGVATITDEDAAVFMRESLDVGGPEFLRDLAEKMIAERLTGQRDTALNKYQTALMLWYQTDLDAQTMDTDRLAQEAADMNDLSALKGVDMMRDRIHGKTLDYLNAARQYGSLAGQSLQALKLRVDHAFNIVKIYRQAYQDNGDIALTPQQYAALKARVAALEKKWNDYMEAASLPDSEAELDARVVELEKKLADATTNRDSLKATVAQLEAKKAALEAEYAKQSGEATAFSEKKAQLEAQIAGLENEIALREALNQQVEELQGKVDALQAKLDALDAEYAGASPELLASLEKQLADLTKLHAEKLAAYQKADEELKTANERLKRVRKLIEKLGKGTKAKIARRRAVLENAANLYGEFKAEMERAQVERLKNRWRGANPAGKTVLAVSVTRDLIRALQSMGDESVAGRQLAKLGLAHPFLWARAWAQSQPLVFSRAGAVGEDGHLLTWAERSDRRLFELDQMMREHPMFDVLVRQGGMSWMDLTADPQSFDEQQTPVGPLLRAMLPSKFTRGYTSLLEVSNNHYAGMSNMLRFAAACQLYEKFNVAKGGTPTAEDIQAIVSTVDIFGGRGNLTSDRAKGFKKFADHFLYSPRLTLSNVQFFKRMAGFAIDPSTSGRAKAMIATEYLRLGATYAVISILARLFSKMLSDDPDEQRFQFSPGHSAFLTLMRGQRRMDISGGAAMWARSVLQILGIGDKLDTETGLVSQTGKKFTKEWPFIDLGDRQNLDYNAVGRLVRSKLDPWAGMTVDLLAGKTYSGQAAGPLAKANFPDYAWRYPNLTSSIAPVPLSIQSLADMLRGDTEQGIAPLRNPLHLLEAFGAQFVGTGASSLPVNPELAQEVDEGYTRNAEEMRTLKNRLQGVLSDRKMSPEMKELKGGRIQDKLDRLRGL